MREDEWLWLGGTGGNRLWLGRIDCVGDGWGNSRILEGGELSIRRSWSCTGTKGAAVRVMIHAATVWARPMLWLRFRYG